MNLLKNNGWKCLWRGHPAQPTDQLKPPGVHIALICLNNIEIILMCCVLGKPKTQAHHHYATIHELLGALGVKVPWAFAHGQ